MSIDAKLALGYRPGAGRPKKAKAGSEYEKIQQMLAIGIKAKAKFYQEFLVRVANKSGNEKPLSLAEKKLMARLAIDLAETGSEKKLATDLEAADFLRQVWNDPGVEMSLRIRAAEVALKGSDAPKGKKEAQNDKAKQAGSGKFAAGAPPRKVIPFQKGNSDEP